MTRFFSLKQIPLGYDPLLKHPLLQPGRLFYASDTDNPIRCDCDDPNCHAVAYKVAAIPTPWDGGIAFHDVWDRQEIEHILTPIAPAVVPELIRKGLENALRDTVTLTRAKSRKGSQ
jgi:hypothetical protein